MRVSDFELTTPMISGLWLRFVELVPISECCPTVVIRQLELRKEDEPNQLKESRCGLKLKFQNVPSNHSLKTSGSTELFRKQKYKRRSS